MPSAHLLEVEALLKLIFRATIPLAMLALGVVLMVSRISGWNLIIGTPIVVLGTVFLIYTYNEVINKLTTPFSEELTRCAFCAKLTPRQAGVDPRDTFCSRCRRGLSAKLAKT